MLYTAGPAVAVTDGDILALTFKHTLLPHTEKTRPLGRLDSDVLFIALGKGCAANNHFAHSRNPARAVPDKGRGKEKKTLIDPLI